MSPPGVVETSSHAALRKPRAGQRVFGKARVVPTRVLFLQLNTGHDIDKGPAWISVVQFNRSWKTAAWHGKTLASLARACSTQTFYDVDTNEEH